MKNSMILIAVSLFTMASSASALQVATITERWGNIIIQMTDKADKKDMLAEMTDCFEPNTNTSLDSVMLGISCKTRSIHYFLTHGYEQNGCGEYFKR